jgi:hypothetical protein
MESLATASTVTAGYPPHRVVGRQTITHPNGVRVTSWQASCGKTGEMVSPATFGKAGEARRGELSCRTCWPAGQVGFR